MPYSPAYKYFVSQPVNFAEEHKRGAEDRSQLYMTGVAPARPDKGPSQAIYSAPGSEIGCHPSLSSDTGRERAKQAEVSDNDFHQSSFSQMSMP